MDEAFDYSVAPSNIEAEQSVLGAAMQAADALSEAVETLRPVDFYRPAHQMIYEVMLDMYADGTHVDMLTLFDVLSRRGQLLQVGGAPYLHTLVSGVPYMGNVGYYAKIVRGKAVKRGLLEAGTRIVAYGRSDEDADDSVRRAEAEVFDIANSHVRGEDYLPLSDIMPEALDEIEAFGKDRKGGVKTGFRDLDELLQGLHPGQFIVVGARPAVGKSTLGLDVAREAVKDEQATVVFSLEMSRTEIVTRLLSAEARVGLHKIRAGLVSDDEWKRIGQRIAEFGATPLFIDDSPNLSMMDIRAKCRRLKQRHDLKLVIVDYLQLMEHGGSRKESRQQEVSDISRSLKLLAKELGVTVIGMSQLNRGPEQRTDKRPQVSDLRESGSVEQDADVVILIFREDMYNKESNRAGEADLIVAKHRNGPTATITAAFQGHYCRFTDMAQT